MDFVELLNTLNDGRTLEELNIAMRDLVADAKNVGKPGILTLTIAVAPEKKRDDVMIIVDKIQVKKPEFDRRAAIFFVDDDYQLLRHDPRQGRMDFGKEK